MGAADIGICTGGGSTWPVLSEVEGLITGGLTSLAAGGVSARGPLRQGSSEASKPIVMLAGGIGITPMYSMIQWATEEKLPHKITLHFSNSAPERATFLKELEALQAQNPNFKLHLHFKRLTTETLKPDLNSRYYLAGPPGFVAGMRAILDEAGVDEDNIRTEEFSGY